MTWNYRLVKRKTGHFEIMEIYYDEKGEPMGMVPVNHIYDEDETVRDVVTELQMIIEDMVSHDIFIEPEDWPGSFRDEINPKDLEDL